MSLEEKRKVIYPVQPGMKSSFHSKEPQVSIGSPFNLEYWWNVPEHSYSKEPQEAFYTVIKFLLLRYYRKPLKNLLKKIKKIRNQYKITSKLIGSLRAQSFTSLKADLRQGMNGTISLKEVLR